MISQEQIQQALKLHKLINKSSTLASAPRTKKGSVQSSKKADTKRTDSKHADSKRTTKKSSKDLTGSVGTIHTIDHSIHDSKPILIEYPRETVAKVEKCEEHPGESLQFYSFSYNKILCPSCLLSGAYSGSETVSIKKAGETIKHKLSDVVIEIEGKLDAYELYSKKLANRKEELKDIALGYKKEVSSNIAQVISKLQAKEKELLEQLDQVQEEKLQDLIQATQKLRAQEDQIRMKKSDVSRHLKDLGGLDLCNYYSKQYQSIQSCLHDEGSLALHEAKLTAETNISLQEKVNLERFKESLRNNNAEIDLMTTYQLEPLIEHPKLSVRLKSPDKETRVGSDKEYLLTAQKTFQERPRDNRMSSDFPPWTKNELMASGSKPVHQMSPHDTRTKFNVKDRPQGIDDILMSGYKRIQEMKGISPSLPATTKSRVTGDVLGVSELLGNSTASKRPASGLAAQLATSKSESKYRSLFGETRFSSRENITTSQKGTPHRGFELNRLSLREGKLH